MTDHEHEETWDEAVERLVSSRQEQGLPRYVEDAATLDLIAAIVVGSPKRKTRADS
jgi:hypothetical protein